MVHHNQTLHDSFLLCTALERAAAQATPPSPTVAAVPPPKHSPHSASAKLVHHGVLAASLSAMAVVQGVAMRPSVVLHLHYQPSHD